MMRASNGKLYGTTDKGGLNNKGIIFRHDASESTVTVHSFDGTHGEAAWAPMVQAADGLLYGTTLYGGANSRGTIYRFDPSTSVFTVVHDFGGTTDGANPLGAPIVGADGALSRDGPADCAGAHPGLLDG